jgi:hypothetical protein
MTTAKFATLKDLYTKKRKEEKEGRKRKTSCSSMFLKSNLYDVILIVVQQL